MKNIWENYLRGILFLYFEIFTAATLINCKMKDTDLAFEKSEVEATVLTPVISIKNPRAGVITVPEVSEIIMDDPEAKGEIKIRVLVKSKNVSKFRLKTIDNVCV